MSFCCPCVRFGQNIDRVAGQTNVFTGGNTKQLVYGAWVLFVLGYLLGFAIGTIGSLLQIIGLIMYYVIGTRTRTTLRGVFQIPG